MIIWQRKLYRLVMGSIFPLTYYFFDFKPALILTGFFLVFMLFVEWKRYQYPGLWPWVVKRFGTVFKTYPGTLTGETWFLVSSFLAILFFPKGVAIAALFFLVFGDAAAGVVGSKTGKLFLFSGKTLEGMLAGIAANAVVGFFLIASPKLNLTWPVILPGILVAGIFEVLSSRLDDNLTVGLSSGIVMTFLYLIRE